MKEKIHNIFIIDYVLVVIDVFLLHASRSETGFMGLFNKMGKSSEQLGAFNESQQFLI